MAASSRTAQFSRLHKILKKYYTPVAPALNRSVLEHLLFASCLENAHYPVAEEAFAALVHTFFDWNEIRVSSVRELSEVACGLPDPAAAAHRVKRILQSVFEATYSFDLEELRKQNLGPAVERLEKIEGTSKFSIACVIQSALSGHAIPIDSGTARALRLLDMATDEDVAAGTIPGLDRAIPKNSGIEFGSLIHQLGADFVGAPYSPALHTILLEIEPKAKDHLPLRRAPKRAVQGATTAGPEDSGETKAKKVASDAKAEGHRHGKTTGTEEPKEADGVKKEAGQEKAAPIVKEAALDPKKKPAPAKKKSAADEPPAEVQQPAAAESPPKKDKDKTEEEEAAKKKQPPPTKKVPPKKKPEDDKAKNPTDQGGETSGLEGISKRKPR
jgi:endonuclease-3